ncbi:hypothetical protein Pla22_44260 [Rubripirellula amarantea]|uniref:Uncharacterized protein n=1 Tax=Rubripirellula amarantea TaxID=2527999 RepID=A0A5C5WER3_9BACT|nr:hypothetical protein Pla22_44260 [Rubripirellula amarantea]
MLLHLSLAVHLHQSLAALLHLSLAVHLHQSQYVAQLLNQHLYAAQLQHLFAVNQLLSAAQHRRRSVAFSPSFVLAKQPRIAAQILAATNPWSHDQDCLAALMNGCTEGTKSLQDASSPKPRKFQKRPLQSQGPFFLWI